MKIHPSYIEVLLNLSGSEIRPLHLRYAFHNCLMPVSREALAAAYASGEEGVSVWEPHISKRFELLDIFTTHTKLLSATFKPALSESAITDSVLETKQTRLIRKRI